MSTVQRRLCAIMFSDIHGYSRMMGKDEEATLRLLDELTKLMTPLIDEHRGAILKFIGDAVLATFDSAADAVECAISIQRRLGERNREKSAAERIFIRIGIHIGDIVLKGGDVFGDGVNVAARVEPTAPPGGICVSDAVHGMIRNIPDIESHNLGPHSLKNIREPVTIHRIVTGAEASHMRTLVRMRAPWRKLASGAAVVAALAFGCFWGWRQHQKRVRSERNPFTIVAAPFYATPEQAKDAARVQQALIRQILNEGLGREPGVRILADGVAKAPRSYAEAKALGKKLDGDLVIWGDVLLLHDELAITPHVTLVKPFPNTKENDPKALHARLSRVQQLDLQAAKANELGNTALLIVAEYFRERQDPDRALNLLARIHPPTSDGLYAQGRIYYGSQRWREMEQALNAATALAPNDARPAKLLGHALYARGDAAGAAKQFEALLKRQPRDPDILQSLGLAYAESGRTQAAEKIFRRALEQDPKHALSYIDLASLYYKRRQFHRAADIYRALIQVQPNHLFAHLLYYVSLRKSGDDKPAADHLASLVKELNRKRKGSAWPGALALHFAGRLPEAKVFELMSQGSADARVRRQCEGYYYLAMARLFDAKNPERERTARAYLAKTLATGLGNFYEFDLARFELAALDEKR